MACNWSIEDVWFRKMWPFVATVVSGVACSVSCDAVSYTVCVCTAVPLLGPQSFCH